MLAADFGDAPVPYPTTLAEGGAEHVIMVGALKLGATIDSETDGTHSASADADDTTGATPDDEDGVTFGTMMVGVAHEISERVGCGECKNCVGRWDRMQYKHWQVITVTRTGPLSVCL